MQFTGSHSVNKTPRAGFTLAEVVITILVLGILIEGLISGYIFSARRAEWSAHSLAAHSLAIQAVEQARAAQWDTGTSPVDELPPSTFSRTEVLDVALTGGQIDYATNYITISTISTIPPLREIRVDCVWPLKGRLTRIYTNTVVTYRAPNQ